MKTLVQDFTAAFLLGFILPGFLLAAAVFNRDQVHAIPETVTETTEAPEKNIRNYILVNKDGAAETWELDTYLVGVLLAEMPADFSVEALKAQAVCARTYAMKAAEDGGKHGDGSVCLEPYCCQAYMTTETYLDSGGTAEAVQKVEQAVLDTSGQVLTYGDSLIEAVYFSSSGGQTEAAVEVWGTDYPYLRSVESPGEEETEYYRDTVTFSAETFANKLAIHPSGEPEKWEFLTEYSSGGSVRVMVIDGVVFTGVQLRNLLQLRSAAFDLEVSDGNIIITTRGYGHRVGMSQYGAEAMAKKGSSYQDILYHYYPGTKLRQLPADIMAEDSAVSAYILKES